MRAIEGISHLTVAASDLAAASADYARLLGVAPSANSDGVHRFAAGNIALHLRATQADEAEGLCEIAFRVADVSRAAHGFARCGLTIDGHGALSRDATHGLPIALVAGTATERDANTIALDHVVIRTGNPERAIALYGGRLGLDMRLDRSNAQWNARLMFFRCGDTVVEIAHVLSDGVSDAPDRFGGLSWRVPDIAAAHARLTRDGFDMSPVRTGRRAGSRVCTVRNRNAGVPTILLGVVARASAD